jgi:hypothetical protein
MIFERINVQKGWPINSYFVGSGSKAVVIDPRRDTQVYLDLALRHGMKIKYILETHRKRRLCHRVGEAGERDYRCGNLPRVHLDGLEIRLHFERRAGIQPGQS